MVVSKNGSLAEVKRHDYLPFGEDVPADGSWRTIGRGYAGDNVRQKFTGYERDYETGLDYAQARYFAPAQGRFASVDPLLASARAGVPQTWNRYTYALNNPLRLTDPTGLAPNDTDPGQVQNIPPRQQPSEVPVIPPIDISLPGSPEYQAQQATTTQGVPIPQAAVDSYAQQVVGMFGNNNGQCGQLINGIFSGLTAPNNPPTFQSAFSQINSFVAGPLDVDVAQTFLSGTTGKTTVTIDFSKATPLDETGLDLSGLKKEEGDSQRFYYHDDAAGFTVEVNSPPSGKAEMVLAYVYRPTAKDEHRRCPRSDNP